MAKKFLCRLDECPPNGIKAFEAEGGPKILVAHSGGEYFGYQAMCPHMDVALEEGFYDGAVLTCHQHLWQWDIRTGAPRGVAEAPLQRYELAEENGVLYVLPLSAVRQTPLFSGVAEPTLDAIALLVRSETFDEGAIIYRPGDPAEDLCILESGRVQFVIGHEDRRSPAGWSLRMGEVFGWAALLDGEPRRIATATCLEKSTVVLINGRALLDVLERDPSAGYLVMRRLASLITTHLTPVGAR